MRDVRFRVQINDKDMYAFHMYHAYTSSQGWLSILFAVLAFGATVLTWGDVSLGYSVAYIVIGILFLVYMPVILRFRAKAQIAGSEVLQNPLYYRMEEQGIVVSIDENEEQDEEKQAILPWQSIYKVVTTKEELFVFSNRVNAYVIPKREIADCYPEIRDVLEEHLEAHRRSLKW